MNKKKCFPDILGYFLAFLVFLLPGCNEEKPKGKPKEIFLEASAYCPCKSCTGWKRNWFLKPVYASGPLKGKEKKVGITADGTKAEKGTIAADTDFYPFGTIFFIPGYGYGVVHDTGGKIKGKFRIDLYYPSHNQALEWGRQRLLVKYWLPEAEN